MDANIIELKLPKFLLAEEPTKEYVGVEWIYSPQYLSLIMIISENDIPTVLEAKNRRKSRKTFTYQDETFEFIIIQNNVAATGGELAPEITDEQFLCEAFDWYRAYLIWEDRNIDENETSILN